MHLAPRHRLSLSRTRANGGFTLIEVLLAATITVVLVGILLRISTLATNTVNLSTQNLSAFAAARSAYDIMTRTISTATLNTYLDYYDSGGNRRTNGNMTNFKPVCFGRASDLQFIIRANIQKNYYGQEIYFQAPRAYSTDPNLQSVTGLLNACGYYVEFGNNSLYEPNVLTAGGSVGKYRYRLMQGLEPTEKLSVFSYTSLSTTGTTTDSNTWISNIANQVSQGSVYITPLADNVIALVAWPQLSANDQAAQQAAGTYTPLTTDYTYDSQANVAPATVSPFKQNMTADQLPPDIQLTMVVLDEASAARVQGTSTVAPTAIENLLKNGGTNPLFTNPTNYQTDLSTLANGLSALHVNFQFFNSTVAMRESKWTTPQQ